MVVVSLDLDNLFNEYQWSPFDGAVTNQNYNVGGNMIATVFF